VTDEPAAPDASTTRTAALAASPPIFRSRKLDRVTRVHPATPALIFGPVIGVLLSFSLWSTSVERTAALFACGWVSWTLCEYWTHRIVFHYEPEDGFGARLHWMIHGVHHDHPNDPRRLVLPPVLSVPFGAAFIALFVSVLGTTGGCAVGAGFVTGYLAYDMVHFALHHHRPRGRLPRLMHQLHMRHHFENEQCGFGVSAPWWDVLFGTYSPRARRAQASRDSTGPDRRT
jgi:sterol desaturase/sphingolipid hydroxylase (fatty acid hydroxylase superfamily)